MITWLLFIYIIGQWRARFHDSCNSTDLPVHISLPLMYHPSSIAEKKCNTWLHFHHVFNGSADANVTREILRAYAWLSDESAPRKGNIFALMSWCKHKMIVHWARCAIHRFIWQHHSLNYSGPVRKVERLTVFLALNERTHHKLH